MLVPLVAMATVGCGGDAKQTAYDIPPGAFQYVSQGQLDELAGMGLVINQGLSPPSVDGTYYADSLVRTGGNIPNDTSNTFANLSLKFASQASDNTLMVSYDQVQADESGDGLGAFVSGAGSSFTIFTQITGMNSGIDFKSAMLLSGSIAADGIHNFVYAILLTQKDPDPTNRVINVDQARVIAESDALAATTTTYP